MIFQEQEKARHLETPSLIGNKKEEITIPHEESCVQNDTRTQLATEKGPETGGRAWRTMPRDCDHHPKTGGRTED